MALKWRLISPSYLSEEESDALVFSEADDESAWTKLIRVLILLCQIQKAQ